LEIGDIIAQAQAVTTKIPVLIQRDLASSKDSDGRDAVIEVFRNLCDSLACIDAEAFATEISVSEEARSAPAIPILVIAVLRARAPGPCERDHEQNQPPAIHKFHDAPPEASIHWKHPRTYRGLTLESTRRGTPQSNLD
jgi:hypothetical protein